MAALACGRFVCAGFYPRLAVTRKETNMQHYSFHIGDYRSATMHLSDAEDLGYRRLLDMYYDTEIPLPDDAALIGRKARVKQSVVKAILAEFFHLTPDGWRHYRCDEELADIYSKSEKAKASADVRWDKKRNADAIRTHSDGNAFGMLPVTRNPEPVTQDPLPKTQDPESKESKPPKVKTLTSAKPPRPEKKVDQGLKASCQATWAAYEKAYFERFGANPVRNATTNSKVKAYCKRIPATEAPFLAAWYVSHGGQRYVAGGHVIGLLLMDCEKLRTEWVTNRKITTLAARQSDRTTGMGQVWADIIEEERLKDEQRTG